MLQSIDFHEPEPWLIGRVASVLARGGLVVVPTDTVYSLVCRTGDDDAIARLYEVKGIASSKRLSLLVPDIATASRFTRGIPNPVFRVMKRVLPGPYTFIFPASGEAPRAMLRKRRTVGVRIPAAPIVLALLAELGEPLLSTSVRNDSDEWVLDPVAIEEELGGQVALVVDGGRLAAEPSTVVDLSEDEPRLRRRGKGDVAALEMFE